MAPEMIAPVVIGDYEIGVLPAEDYARLDTLPDGCLYGRHVQPSPGLVILAVERTADHALMGYWPVFNVVHIDGLYLTEDVQHHPKVALGLLGALVALLQAGGVQGVYAQIDSPLMQKMAGDLGLEPLPGLAYRGAVPLAASPTEPQ